jgi:5,10-methylenetetrahydromethanopterin reductase
VRDELGVRIGYGAGTAMTSVAQVRDEARWAEAVGFDAFWVSQVFGVDPLVALAAVGSDVPGLAELGTSVVPLTGRHPLALAAQALTAQQAVDGRLTLGVGTSHQVVAEGLFGESFARPCTRAAEHLAALLPLLRGEPADVAGEELVARGGLTIEAPPCPVLLAALGPRMLDLAGRLTAGTTVGQCGPRTIATHIAPRLAEAAAAAGRPEPRIVALVTVGVTTDPDGRREELRRGSALYDSFASYRTALDREGVASGADLVLLGSGAVIADGLAAYAEAGATDLRIGIAASDERERDATRQVLADLLAR